MIYIHHYTLLNALGRTPAEVRDNWQKNRAPDMRAAEFTLASGARPLFGHVTGALPEIDPRFAPCHASRNNRLLLATLEADSARWTALIGTTPKERIAVVLGTSTSGSEEAAAYIDGKVHHPEMPSDFSGYAQEMGDPARFLAKVLDLRGPAYTICTACTSSARAIMSAARLIEAGVADAAIAGGADTLARMPLNGFDALGVLSPTLTRPLSRDRAGITIGEAAGLLWLSKERGKIALTGMGESSDAYHMSSPDPEGGGAESAMRNALRSANLTPSAVEYINLHGTGTQQNDAAECAAVGRLFGGSPLISSTKALTGHTLGAAGVTDALLCLIALEHGVKHPAQFEPGEAPDPAFSDLRLITQPAELHPRIVMSNNFAFGGNNTSLIFQRDI